MVGGILTPLAVLAESTAGGMPGRPATCGTSRGRSEGVERAAKRAEKEPPRGSERNLPVFGVRTTAVARQSRKHGLGEIRWSIGSGPVGGAAQRERVLVHGVPASRPSSRSARSAGRPRARGGIALALGRRHVVDRQLALIRGLPKGDAHESGGLQLEPDQGAAADPRSEEWGLAESPGAGPRTTRVRAGQQLHGPPHHVIVLNEAKDIERATNLRALSYVCQKLSRFRTSGHRPGSSPRTGRRIRPLALSRASALRSRCCRRSLRRARRTARKGRTLWQDLKSGLSIPVRPDPENTASP